MAVEVAGRLGKPLFMAIKVNEPHEVVHWKEVVEPLLDEVEVTVVHHAGPEETADLIARARAVLLPLQCPEPFGLVMKANARGTPVVAFAHGAAPEVIADGQSGYLVEPGDIDGLCTAVARAGSLDPGACLENVAKKFTDRQMIDGYLQVYTDAIADRARPDLPDRR